MSRSASGTASEWGCITTPHNMQGCSVIKEVKAGGTSSPPVYCYLTMCTVSEPVRAIFVGSVFRGDLLQLQRDAIHLNGSSFWSGIAHRTQQREYILPHCDARQLPLQLGGSNWEGAAKTCLSLVLVPRSNSKYKISRNRSSLVILVRWIVSCSERVTALHFLCQIFVA